MTRVLFIEDNAEVADSILRAIRLEFPDVAVVHAASVEDAKLVYADEGVDSFDAMVVDYELPDGTGLDFIASISGSDKARVVLFSGLDRSREIVASGMDVEQISKGDPDALLTMIESLR